MLCDFAIEKYTVRNSTIRNLYITRAPIRLHLSFAITFQWLLDARNFFWYCVFRVILASKVMKKGKKYNAGNRFFGVFQCLYMHVNECNVFLFKRPITHKNEKCFQVELHWWSSRERKNKKKIRSIKTTLQTLKQKMNAKHNTSMTGNSAKPNFSC